MVVEMDCVTQQRAALIGNIATAAWPWRGCKQQA
jgi:hypothetical protein